MRPVTVNPDLIKSNDGPMECHDRGKKEELNEKLEGDGQSGQDERKFKPGLQGFSNRIVK